MKSRSVTAAVAITYLYLVVVAIVERHDEDSGRRQVKSVYTHLSCGPVTSILS